MCSSMLLLMMKSRRRPRLGRLGYAGAHFRINNLYWHRPRCSADCQSHSAKWGPSPFSTSRGKSCDLRSNQRKIWQVGTISGFLDLPSKIELKLKGTLGKTSYSLLHGALRKETFSRCVRTCSISGLRTVLIISSSPVLEESFDLGYYVRKYKVLSCGWCISVWFEVDLDGPVVVAVSNYTATTNFVHATIFHATSLRLTKPTSTSFQSKFLLSLTHYTYILFFSKKDTTHRKWHSSTDTAALLMILSNRYNLRPFCFVVYLACVLLPATNAVCHLWRKLGGRSCR